MEERKRTWEARTNTRYAAPAKGCSRPRHTDPYRFRGCESHLLSRWSRFAYCTGLRISYFGDCSGQYEYCGGVYCLNRLRPALSSHWGRQVLICPVGIHEPLRQRWVARTMAMLIRALMKPHTSEYGFSLFAERRGVWIPSQSCHLWRQ